MNDFNDKIKDRWKEKIEKGIYNWLIDTYGACLNNYSSLSYKSPWNTEKYCSNSFCKCYRHFTCRYIADGDNTLSESNRWFYRFG